MHIDRARSIKPGAFHVASPWTCAFVSVLRCYFMFAVRTPETSRLPNSFIYGSIV
jgi:hypothetical protein